MRWIYRLDSEKDWQNENDDRETEKEMKTQKRHNDALA
jgi:hypothetical protein